ncbi:MAG: exodeoxyribonuclease III, partial [Deltaproteobacteria bacterium]|nr:exodeoxyribonuclease III [Deltaproteobacteria bacterium]
MGRTKLATWNVNGLRAREAQLLEWLERERPDVVCTQEIKVATESVPLTLRELPGYVGRWHGTGAYSGVGLHLRKERFGSDASIAPTSIDRECRTLAAEVGDVVLASVYVPNGGKDFPAKMSFLADLERWIASERARGRAVVVAGDINIARTDDDVHPKERKAGAIGQRPDEREQLERILAGGMSDVVRALRPDDHELFTWWAPWRNLRQRNIGWRIDYVLASEPWASRAKECAS